MELPTTDEELTQFILSGQRIMSGTLADLMLYERVCEHISNNLFLVESAAVSRDRDTLIVFLRTTEFFNVTKYDRGDRYVYRAIINNFVEYPHGVFKSK